jgi:hypothetical protein
MALTTADLTAIETAIASGVLRVRFSDGREVQYQSLSDLLKAREFIKNDLTQSGGTASTRATFASFTKD